MGVEKLQPTDVVIDIGAHFGTFSYLCYMLGSRNIYSYEPVAENIKLFTDFIGDLDGITLIPQAVFRSDLEPDYKLNYLGLFSENTGMASVIMDGNYNDFVTQKFIVQDPELRQIANVVPLDEILKNFERVKVLKLDCEGSEFPILLTSKFLSKVDRIVGEYHEVPQAVYQHISPFARTTKYKSYNYEMLEKKLTQDGFNVSKKYSGSNIGIFEAKNKMLK
ncbi:MAG: FkbM family methyltransferase [Chloroflexi bacterium]|nr:FkbM family methyltransferase [Chloroflexota bacterium]